MVRADVIERGDAVVEHQRLITGVAQHFADEVADRYFVVDDQNVTVGRRFGRRSDLRVATAPPAAARETSFRVDSSRP